MSTAEQHLTSYHLIDINSWSDVVGKPPTIAVVGQLGAGMNRGVFFQSTDFTPHPTDPIGE